MKDIQKQIEEFAREYATLLHGEHKDDVPAIDNNFTNSYEGYLYGASFGLTLSQEEYEHNLWELEDRRQTMKTIIEVMPKSFKPLTESQEKNHFYLAECDKCGWWGSSDLIQGGGAIGDTGDYSDSYCPICGSLEIGDMEFSLSREKKLEEALREFLELCDPPADTGIEEYARKRREFMNKAKSLLNQTGDD